MSSPQLPDWACESFGEWRHDWIDCPVCVAGFEAWTEARQQEPDPQEVS